MKILVLLLAACFAALAADATQTRHIDIYKNTLLSPNARIVGGVNATRNQFPYQASLRWAPTNESTPSHICGASLIDENTLLTAAHCKAYSYGVYDVILGQLNQGESHEDVQVIKVADFTAHSGYPGGGVVAADDIAIIKLETSAVLSKAVKPVELANASDCDAIEPSLLSGWGLTRTWGVLPTTLQWLEAPRITDEQCRDDLISVLGNAGPLDDTMLCISSNEGASQQQSSCNGDSGGPLVLNSSNRLTGVVSWGITPCGTPKAPSVFTRVCSHLDWIAENR